MENNIERTLITKLRISNHNLEIEQGRYRGLQVDDRICKLCNKEIEDETHFLLKCIALEEERKSFITKINKTNTNFKNLDFKEQFIWLMSNEDILVIKDIGILINNLNNTRKHLLEMKTNTPTVSSSVLLLPT